MVNITPSGSLNAFPFSAEDTTLVVLCGGSGTRLWPLTLEKQKAMLPVSGVPLIRHIVDFWLPFCRNAIYVVKHGKEELTAYLETLPLDARFVEPRELRGIANGLSYVRPFVRKHFIVVLGDCLCRGVFAFPPAFALGVGVKAQAPLKDIQHSYSVEIASDTGLLSRVVEKPKNPPNDLCGLGFYFFDMRVFSYIENTHPSALRNEIEITDVIENMIRGGEPVSPVPFSGRYVNVTYPDDLEIAADILTEKSL
ncbi:MAG: nucleotidyltransferase family protein [Candidatus Ozemobacteraceae bacterium]